MDILFRTEEYVFSCRVAGICVQNGKMLLQKLKEIELFPTNVAALMERQNTEVRHFIYRE